MDDPQDEHDPILFDHVVHDSVVADPEPMKRIGHSSDGLHSLTPDPPGRRRVNRELLESLADAGSRIWRQSLEGTNGGRR
jgi:hypothetical protein